jgi:hypothetical protein
MGWRFWRRRKSWSATLASWLDFTKDEHAFQFSLNREEVFQLFSVWIWKEDVQESIERSF